MIQVRQTEDDVTAKGLLVLLAHTSGLHAAGMLGLVWCLSFWPVRQKSSMSAQAIYHSSRRCQSSATA
jgi:hypothetical protein